MMTVRYFKFLFRAMGNLSIGVFLTMLRLLPDLAERCPDAREHTGQSQIFGDSSSTQTNFYAESPYGVLSSQCLIAPECQQNAAYTYMRVIE